MRELLFIVGSEKKMIRDFAIIGLAIIGLALLGLHGVKAAAAMFTAQAQPQPTMASGVKTYTITRSVLDDNPLTGSIQNLNQVRLPPCGK
jgi:hypothetical protein